VRSHSSYAVLSLLNEAIATIWAVALRTPALGYAATDNSHCA
jgi:hypothetical protein